VISLLSGQKSATITQILCFICQTHVDVSDTLRCQKLIKLLMFMVRQLSITSRGKSLYSFGYQIRAGFNCIWQHICTVW